MKLSLAAFAACTVLAFLAVRAWREPPPHRAAVEPHPVVAFPIASPPEPVAAVRTPPALTLLPAPPEDPRTERLLDAVLPYFPGSPMGVVLATAAVNESLGFDGDVGEVELDAQQALSAISSTLEQLPKQHSGVRRELISLVSDLRVPEPQRVEVLRREALRTGALVTPADTAIAFDALVELLEHSPSRVQPIYDELKRAHAGDLETLAALEQARPRAQ